MARAGEQLAQDRSDPPRLPLDLLFAEPDNLIAPRSQLQVATPIVSERLAAAVVSKPVGLNNQPPIAPKEIYEVGADTDVDFRFW